VTTCTGGALYRDRGGDDAIVLKSDWSRGRELSTRNITVRDCAVGSLGNNSCRSRQRRSAYEPTAVRAHPDHLRGAGWDRHLDDGQRRDAQYNITSATAVGPGIVLQDVDLSWCLRGGGNASLLTREVNHAAMEAYPAPAYMGPRPAYGLYIRHARGIVLDRVTLGSVRRSPWK